MAAASAATEGLCLTTVNYRAPEVALGDRSYSYPVDCWPLGCVFAEVLQRQPLFSHLGGEIGMILQQFRLRGAPSEGRLTQLPQFKSTLPAFPSTWPPAGLQGWPALVLDLLSGLLTLEPAERMTAAPGRPPSPVVLSAPAARGVCTLVAWRLDYLLLE